MGFLSSWLIPAIIGFALVEAYVWLPKLNSWLIDRCVAKLPPDHQERYREEWTEAFSMLPNSVWSFFHACSFFISGSAEKITSEIQSSELSRASDELGRLDYANRKIFRQLTEAAEKMSSWACRRQELSDVSSNTLYLISKSLEDHRLDSEWVQETKVSCKSDLEYVQRNMDQAHSLLETDFRQFMSMADEMREELVSAKRLHLKASVVAKSGKRRVHEFCSIMVELNRCLSDISRKEDIDISDANRVEADRLRELALETVRSLSTRITPVKLRQRL